jgi:hypothetical protein
MDKITLANLGNGGLEEQFQMALEQVLWNIDDPNAKSEAVRKVVITIDIKPTKSGDMGSLRYSVTPKLAPHEAQETLIGIGKEEGSIVAKELSGDPAQMTIDDFAKPKLVKDGEASDKEASSG